MHWNQCEMYICMEKSVESLPRATSDFFLSNCSFTRTVLELNKLAFERMLKEELLVKNMLKLSL